MEKQGPTVITQANGRKLVCVPTDTPFRFRIIALDTGADYDIMAAAIEGMKK